MVTSCPPLSWLSPLAPSPATAKHHDSIPRVSAAFLKNRSKLRPRKSHGKWLGLPWSSLSTPHLSAGCRPAVIPTVIFHVFHGVTVSFLHTHSCPAPSPQRLWWDPCLFFPGSALLALLTLSQFSGADLGSIFDVSLVGSFHWEQLEARRGNKSQSFVLLTWISDFCVWQEEHIQHMRSVPGELGRSWGKESRGLEGPGNGCHICWDTWMICSTRSSGMLPRLWNNTCNSHGMLPLLVLPRGAASHWNRGLCRR